MNQSILHFNEKGTQELMKHINKFLNQPTNLDTMVEGVLDVLLELGLDIIKETLEDADECIRQSSVRKSKYNINRKEETQLLCKLGNIRYKRTLFQDKSNKTYRYILDDLMGIRPHTRMTKGAEAALIEEAIDSSYSKAGLQVSLTDFVSKQTVKNKIHNLNIANNYITNGVKKKVEILYIDADEDHISRQFYYQKGDIRKKPSGIKYNTMLGKMIYVYEGTVPEHETSKRRKLINKKYFGGIYNGSKNNVKLWNEVSSYIENTYDTDYLKVVYINGDGASWIKDGVNHIVKSKFVLDRFHLMKYINQATSHLLDSQNDAKSMIYKAIYKSDKKEIKNIFKLIESVTESESKLKVVIDSKKYILNNWNGIITRIENKDIIGCSAEGHISHVFSKRLSSRPMGWSEHGANQMCKLRCYKENGGKVITLLNDENLQSTGTEGTENRLMDIIGRSNTYKNTDDYYVNRIRASIPGYSAMKHIAISTKLYGL